MQNLGALDDDDNNSVSNPKLETIKGIIYSLIDFGRRIIKFNL